MVNYIGFNIFFIQKESYQFLLQAVAIIEKNLLFVVENVVFTNVLEIKET